MSPSGGPNVMPTAERDVAATVLSNEIQNRTGRYLPTRDSKQVVELIYASLQPMRAARPVPPLPPFSGDDSQCPKCGYIPASVRYLAHGVCLHAGDLSEVIGLEPNERLHRECRRCGYAWCEALMDPALLNPAKVPEGAV